MEDEPTTRDRLLDAALEAAAVHGLAKLSMGDVARTAGLSRQTLYKHVSSKDELVAQAVGREAQRMAAEVVAVAEAEPDSRRALEAAILTTLAVARDHPLLDRLVRTEPEALLPFLVSDGGVVGTFVRQLVEGIIAEREPDLDPVTLRRVADMISRLLISYAVNAPDDPPEVVAEVLASVVVGGFDSMLPETPRPSATAT